MSTKRARSGRWILDEEFIVISHGLGKQEGDPKGSPEAPLTTKRTSHWFGHQTQFSRCPPEKWPPLDRSGGAGSPRDDISPRNSQQIQRRFLSPAPFPVPSAARFRSGPLHAASKRISITVARKGEQGPFPQNNNPRARPTPAAIQTAFHETVGTCLSQTAPPSSPKSMRSKTPSRMSARIRPSV